MHRSGRYCSQPAWLLCPAASPPCSSAEGRGGDPTGKLHGAQAVLWYPIQRINTTFCSLDAAASWPSVHIQFAHFLSALTCINLLKRLSSKEQTNREMNRRLCWLWRGRLLLFPCFHECGPLQYIQCRLSALLSQMRALLCSVKHRLCTQHLCSFRNACWKLDTYLLLFLSAPFLCCCLSVP